MNSLFGNGQNGSLGASVPLIVEVKAMPLAIMCVIAATYGPLTTSYKSMS